MLGHTPFLQLIPARAQTCLQRVKNQIWQEHAALPVDWAGCSTEHASLARARKRKLKRNKKPFYWGTLEDQGWFRIRIPSTFRDGTWHLEWKEQGESTAYVSGLPYAGLDVAHHRCRIPEGCREIWMEVMVLESGIWLQPDRPAITPEGCRFEGARACQRNDLAWEVCHDLEVLLDLLQSEYDQHTLLKTPFGQQVGYTSPVDVVSVLYRRLARHVDGVVSAYEAKGLSGARKELRSVYRALQGTSEPIRCRLTGHAHIDLVWLWTEKAAEFKAVHSFATANRLMEDYPEFRFGYSQPASYRAVESRSPLLMKAVRQRIHEGKWEAVGAMEVESDTQLACGEGLVRSLLLGQEGFTNLQGKPSPILWLPDVFGYSACLPQLMKQCGVDYFFTTKLHWGSITQFPYSSFVWRGTDGSEVLAHVSQGMGYNQTVTPTETRDGAREYRQSDVHDEFLMPSGYGDGGGGPTPEMCERARRMNDLAGTPSTNWGRIDTFFEELDKERAKLPAYYGELYLQYHRGVLTTHGDLKAAFRSAERALQAWEAVHCATGKGAIDKQAWRRLVFAQFHDYIPGSSIPEVYAEAVPELCELAQTAQAQAEQGLSKETGRRCLFNPLPLSRRVFVDDKLVELPPLAGVAVDDRQPLPYTPPKASRKRLRSDRVDARFDNKGRIRSLTIDGQPVSIDKPLGQLMLFPDQPHAYDAWDIDRSTLSTGIPVKNLQFAETRSDTVAAWIEFRGMIKNNSPVSIRYILEPDSPVLKVEYEIDWREPEHLLKVLFPTNYKGSHARFGDPFGSTLRSQQPGQPHDEAQWEVSGNRYAVVCDDGQTEGLFVVTESKYGWACCDGTLGLSLLRSARMRIPQRIGSDKEGTGLPIFSDLKKHIIRLAIGRFHAGCAREDTPAALGDSLYTHTLPYNGVPVQTAFLGLEGGPSLIPCWAMPDDSGEWTLRLHETLGCRGRIRVLLKSGWSLKRTNLSGSPWPEQPLDHQMAFKPFEVISLRLFKES